MVETIGDKLSGNTGFNDVAGYDFYFYQKKLLFVLRLSVSYNTYMYIIHPRRYIFGKNSTAEKIPMTTPVFTQAIDPDLSKVSIQIVLPLEKKTERYVYLVSLVSVFEELLF